MATTSEKHKTKQNKKKCKRKCRRERWREGVLPFSGAARLRWETSSNGNTPNGNTNTQMTEGSRWIDYLFRNTQEKLKTWTVLKQQMKEKPNISSNDSYHSLWWNYLQLSNLKSPLVFPKPNRTNARIFRKNFPTLCNFLNSSKEIRRTKPKESPQNSQNPIFQPLYWKS